MGGRCVVYVSPCLCRVLHVVKWVVGIYSRVVYVRSSHVPVVRERKHMCLFVGKAVFCVVCKLSLCTVERSGCHAVWA